MIEESVLLQLKGKIRHEIEETKQKMKKEIDVSEMSFYRETKIFVYAKSIELNLEEIIAELENNKIILDKFINVFLKEDNIIEKLYMYLFENNGYKYDLFIKKQEVISCISFFLGQL